MTALVQVSSRWLLWQLPRPRFPSESHFALTISALWLVIYNGRFWSEVFGALWRPGFAGVLFVVALAVLVLFIQALPLLLVPTQRGMRAVAAILCVVGSGMAYFTSTFGAVMNVDMVRNVFETDASEAGDLVSLSLLLHVTLLGVVPAVLAWRSRMPAMSWRRQWTRRGAFIGIGLATSLALALASSATFAVFLREQKPLRSMISPVSMLWSTGAYLGGRLRAGESQSMLPDPGGPAWRVADAMPVGTRKPTLVVMVVGETARAANFQLGGYGRETNPYLAARRDLHYFSDATSCGTSTAISVPCMFSQSGRSEFSAAQARRIPNILDVLASMAVDVTWLDNNSGCKGVCARVPTMNLGAGRQGQLLPAVPATCEDAPCFDSALGEALAAQLANRSRTGTDQLFVIHQNGSHGPAYAERYPESDEHFRPACHSNRLDACSHEEVLNAYDNSIRYTDRMVAELITQLEARQGEFNSLLIYASDHGESLGEQGLYLHGMPYAFAPEEQKKVPMLMWISPGLRESIGLDGSCLATQAHKAVSHDNLFHTILGAFGVRNKRYQSGLDLISSCTGSSDDVKIALGR
jgi:lipid A ethanolaminephosphotransferase